MLVTLVTDVIETVQQRGGVIWARARDSACRETLILALSHSDAIDSDKLQ